MSAYIPFPIRFREAVTCLDYLDDDWGRRSPLIRIEELNSGLIRLVLNKSPKVFIIGEVIQLTAKR